MGRKRKSKRKMERMCESREAAVDPMRFPVFPNFAMNSLSAYDAISLDRIQGTYSDFDICSSDYSGFVWERGGSL